MIAFEPRRGLRKAGLVEEDLDGLGRGLAGWEPRSAALTEAGYGRHPLIRTRDERYPLEGQPRETDMITRAKSGRSNS